MWLRGRWNPGPVLAAVLLGLLTSLPSAAQYTFGRVEGIILDPSGATISGTVVKLQHPATDTARSFTTGADGVYVFFAVPPGDYRLSAEAPGFATKSAQFKVSSNRTVTVNLTLGVSAEKTSIEVMGEPGTLDVTDAQHSHTLSATELALLPNLSRNMITTVTLAPGVQPTNNPRGGSTFGGGSPGFAVALGVQSGLISANGGRAYATSVQLDYTDANDWEFGGFAPAMQAITPDMLEEFKLLTSNFSAEYGVKSNAQIIMVTKSGTNRWHGTAYDYLQNDLFNARDYFDKTGQASKLKQNIYGFTMGGPAVKDRTFLFGGYEGRKTRGASFTNPGVSLPTEQARARATDPIITDLMNQFLPLPPTNTGDLGTINTQIPSPVDSYQFIVKADHRFSDAHAFSARYVQGTASFVARFPSSNQLPGFDGDDEFALRNVNLTDSYILNSRAVNELRLAYGYDRGTVATQNGLLTPRFQIQGLVNFGALERLPTNRTFNVHQVNDVLNLVRGAHVLKMGVDARKIQDNSRSDSKSRGVFTFSISPVPHPWDAFLSGQPSNWTQLFGSTQRGFRTGLYGFFLQDDWKIRHDLTLSLGFRWDVQGALSEAHGLTSVLDPNTPGEVGAAGPGLLGSFRVGGPAVNSNPALPGPRLGFAWNPHRGSLVLRGGYGIYWDSFTFAPLSLSRSAPPLNYNLTLTGSQISGANSFDNLYNGTAPILAQGASQVGGFGNLLNFGAITTIDPNLRNAYIQDFTLGVEYRLYTYVIGLSYIGTKGTHLTKLVPINPVVNGPAPATSLADETARLDKFQQAFARESGVGNIRLDPRFDQVNLHTSTGSSIYHSLQAEVRKSFSHGLQFQAAYTWSRSIDDASDFNPSILANDSSFPQSASNPAGERAVSDFDIAQRLIVTSIWQVPFFHRMRGAAGKILDGWGFESSNIWQTGLPATLLSGSRLGIPDGNLDGNLVGASAALEDNTRANCDPAGVRFTLGYPVGVFSGVSQPLLGNNGTCGRNSIRMPGLTNFDWALSKDFRLAEGGPLGSGPWELQFRTEALNVFNIPFLTATGDAWRTASNIGASNIVLTGPFAKVNAAGSTRKLQFALKLIW